MIPLFWSKSTNLILAFRNRFSTFCLGVSYSLFIFLLRETNDLFRAQCILHVAQHWSFAKMRGMLCCEIKKILCIFSLIQNLIRLEVLFFICRLFQVVLIKPSEAFTWSYVHMNALNFKVTIQLLQELVLFKKMMLDILIYDTNIKLVLKPKFQPSLNRLSNLDPESK